jgi:hypothetical protein
MFLLKNQRVILRRSTDSEAPAAVVAHAQSPYDASAPVRRLRDFALGET